jgi:hypothetical protein
MSYHFWRVRKDGGLTIPKAPGEELPRKMESVTTIPYLVRPELMFAIASLALIFFWAMLVPAPLEGIANPLVSPNPAKAPWYFMGLQELLLHFHPVVGAIVLPGMALTALILLPFYDLELKSVGVYFRSRRGRYLTLFSIGLSILITPTWVLLDEYMLHWTEWLPGWPTWISNGFIPLTLLLLGIFILDRIMVNGISATKEERILVIFNYLFTALIILTVIGIFFRGPGMELFWPWLMPVH